MGIILNINKIQKKICAEIQYKPVILIFKLKVYKKSSKSSHIWFLRRFFVYTLIKN